MAYKLGGKILNVGQPFTYNNVNYPRNWLSLTTLNEKKAIGITVEADPTPEPWFDTRFYKKKDDPRPLTDVNIVDEKGDPIKDPETKENQIEKGVKTIYLEQQKEQASNRLSPYDWYVTRKAEKGTAIPSTISNYRDAVRAAYETRKTEITNASDVVALQKLIDGTITAWPDDIKEE